MSGIVSKNEFNRYKCCISRKFTELEALIMGGTGTPVDVNTTIGPGDPDGSTPTTPNTYINSTTNNTWYYDGTNWIEDTVDRMFREEIAPITASDLNADGSFTYVVNEGSIDTDPTRVNLYVRVMGQDKEYTVGGAITYVGSTGTVTIAPLHVNVGDIVVIEYHTA